MSQLKMIHFLSYTSFKALKDGCQQLDWTDTPVNYTMKTELVVKYSLLQSNLNYRILWKTRRPLL